VEQACEAAVVRKWAEWPALVHLQAVAEVQ
jgi:hypothetical protein